MNNRNGSLEDTFDRGVLSFIGLYFEHGAAVFHDGLSYSRAFAFDTRRRIHDLFIVRSQGDNAWLR